MQTENTYLLNTRSYQDTFLVEYPLDHYTSSISRPRAFHFLEHPLVRLDASGLVEIDTMVKADHHAQRGPISPLLQITTTVKLTLIRSTLSVKCPP